MKNSLFKAILILAVIIMNSMVSVNAATVVFDPGINDDWYSRGVFYGRGIQLQCDEAGECKGNLYATCEFDTKESEYRYIAVKVLGCDKWSESSKYVSASIFEIGVNASAADNERLLIRYNKKENTLTSEKDGILIVCDYGTDYSLKKVLLLKAAALAPVTPTFEITSTTRVYLWDSFMRMKPLSVAWNGDKYMS